MNRTCACVGVAPSTVAKKIQPNTTILHIAPPRDLHSVPGPRRERYNGTFPPVNAAEIAQVFEEIARLLAFKGDNPFKVRAYRNAARTLRSLDEDLGAVIAEGRLRRLPAIGTALANKIEDLARVGTTPLWERLRDEIPPGVVDMAAIPGLGPQRASAVHQALGVA